MAKNVSDQHSSVEIEMADIVNVIMEETCTYPIHAFISDTGGAAGLFLGLHCMGKYPTR